jgi:hypothetical protein
MAYFPTSPVDGEPVTVNGILYTYNATKGAWKRAVSSINNLDVAGNITAAGNISAGNVSVTNKVAAGAIYTTSGLFWAGNGVAFSSFPTALDANVGVLFLGNASTNANLGTLFLGNASTQANLGAFQTFSNANAAAQATSINTINANLGAYQIYANANIGTLFLGNASTQANLGILFLGNATTQANLGSFQTFSNANAAAQATSINTINANLGSFQTFSNTNAAAQATSINTINANLGAYQIYANANIGTLFLGNASTQANLGAFQIFSNANAASQQVQINNIVTNANANTAAYLTTYTGNIGAGNIITTGVSGNISGVNYIFATNYVYPNGVSILSGIGGTYSNTNVEAYFGANIGSLLVNAATQATSINTINANLGAYQTYANTTFTSYSNNNVAAYLTLGANIGSGTTTANLVAAATTTSTSTTTGALVVRGGAGIAGNVYSDRFYTASGIFWSGNGAAYAAAGGGGGSFTASASAPVAPSLGSFWYKTTTDVLYEYINDGTTDYWIDIQTQTIAANTSGPSMYAGDVFGANITFTGTITGSVGYLIERANVVASSPPATTNLDLITAPIMYFTSNTTQNITANIRGNATVTLNSLLAIGQSSTFVIFIPNATAYYVNTVRIDNVTVTPFWQGGSSVVSGNSNSIDIYTFAVLKTADATFKVFASQVRYQNLGP